MFKVYLTFRCLGFWTSFSHTFRGNHSLMITELWNCVNRLQGYRRYRNGGVAGAHRVITAAPADLRLPNRWSRYTVIMSTLNFVRAKPCLHPLFQSIFFLHLFSTALSPTLELVPSVTFVALSINAAQLIFTVKLALDCVCECFIPSREVSREFAFRSRLATERVSRDLN